MHEWSESGRKVKGREGRVGRKRKGIKKDEKRMESKGKKESMEGM